jgi:hypothetical protein
MPELGANGGGVGHELDGIAGQQQHEADCRQAADARRDPLRDAVANGGEPLRHR